jgi:hypothetical protein
VSPSHPIGTRLECGRRSGSAGFVRLRAGQRRPPSRSVPTRSRSR